VREKGVVLPHPHEFGERFRWRLATQVASVALEARRPSPDAAEGDQELARRQASRVQSTTTLRH